MADARHEVRIRYRAICSDDEFDVVRRQAYRELFDLVGVPRPEVSAVMTARSFDWNAIDRIVAETGAAMPSSVDSTITGFRFARNDQYEAASVVLEVHPNNTFTASDTRRARRAWLGELVDDGWRQILGALELDRFPVAPVSIVGGQMVTIELQHGLERERVVFPPDTLRYRDVMRLASAILATLDADLAAMPPNIALLVTRLSRDSP